MGNSGIISLEVTHTKIKVETLKKMPFPNIRGQKLE